MLRYLLAGLLLPGCLTAAWLILRRPFREICEEIHFEKARDRFRGQRERLEARFVGLAGRLDPAAEGRWEEARWHDEVCWARDRKSRRLLALVGVHFEPGPFSDEPPRPATALFEFRGSAWTTDGGFLDEVGPEEAMLSQARLEPIFVARRRPSQAGGTMM